MQTKDMLSALKKVVFWRPWNQVSELSYPRAVAEVRDMKLAFDFLDIILDLQPKWWLGLGPPNHSQPLEASLSSSDVPHYPLPLLLPPEHAV